jgi:antitoxin MazE
LFYIPHAGRFTGVRFCSYSGCSTDELIFRLRAGYDGPFQRGRQFWGISILDLGISRDTMDLHCIPLKGVFPMVKRLTQHGNSAALIIDKPVLDLLKITMDTPLEIATDGRNLIISPIPSARREQRFRSALEAVNRRHGKTLKALAE